MVIILETCSESINQTERHEQVQDSVGARCQLRLQVMDLDDRALLDLAVFLAVNQALRLMVGEDNGEAPNNAIRDLRWI